MIKNSAPELEHFLAHGNAPSSSVLVDLLDSVGLDYQDDGEKVVMLDALEVLDPAAILDHLGSQSSPLASDIRLEIYRQVDSTNDVVMKALAEPATLVCLAEMQSAGKGRRGRNWVSPFGQNIYLTIGRHMSCSVSALEGLSLVIGMQVVDALRQLGMSNVGLKWPNDVLLGGGKLGGILVEITPPSPHGTGVVLGVGINLVIDEKSAAQIDQPWSAASGKVSRNELAGLLVAKLLKAIEQFDEGGFPSFATRWNEYNLYADQSIMVIRGNETFLGIDRGVDSKGNLLLETTTGIETHNSGEVSMRPLSRP